MFQLLCVLGSIFLSLGASAAENDREAEAEAANLPGGIQLGRATHAGCGAIRVLRTGAALEIEIQNLVQLDAARDGRNLTRAGCSISIPVDIDRGLRLVIRDASLRTEVSLKNKTSALISLEAGLAGQRAKKSQVRLGGPARNAASLAKIKGVAASSVCGQDSIVRLNTSILLKGLRGEASADQVKLKILAVPCR